MKKIFTHTFKTIVASLIFFAAPKLYAQKVFDFSITCKNAYQQITALKLAAGEELVNQARKENPNNLIPEILDNYIDFYTLFFNEDPEDYKTRIPKFETRLDKIEDGTESSPYYNFCRTVIYMQRACVEIKFGKQWAAGWDFRKSFALIKQNKKAFPAFLPNNMVSGPMMVAASTVPDGYKWLAGLFGIKGSLTDGVNEIQKLVNSNDELAKLFFNEASFYYCYVLFYIQNKPEEAFAFIQQRKLDVVNNHLLAYMAANLAINNKQSDYAKNIILGRKISPEYLSTSIWDLEMGYIKLHHLETQEAAAYFQSFISKFRGNYYVKDASEKLSWCWYLQNNMTAAGAARQQAISKGGTLTDADKQALKNAKGGKWPNMLLLKARLLNDGGYNSDALNVLMGKSAKDFSSASEQLEFAYRVGRIYDDMGRDDEAVRMYLLAIKLGEKSSEYYASRAALQIGLIYETQNKKDQAIQYFNECLGMKDHDYKDSIDQKAKAGLARCKGT